MYHLSRWSQVIHGCIGFYLFEPKFVEKWMKGQHHAPGTGWKNRRPYRTVHTFPKIDLWQPVSQQFSHAIFICLKMTSSLKTWICFSLNIFILPILHFFCVCVCFKIAAIHLYTSIYILFSLGTPGSWRQREAPPFRSDADLALAEKFGLNATNQEGYRWP